MGRQSFLAAFAMAAIVLLLGCVKKKGAENRSPLDSFKDQQSSGNSEVEGRGVKGKEITPVEEPTALRAWAVIDSCLSTGDSPRRLAEVMAVNLIHSLRKLTEAEARQEAASVAAGVANSAQPIPDVTLARLISSLKAQPDGGSVVGSYLEELLKGINPSQVLWLRGRILGNELRVPEIPNSVNVAPDDAVFGISLGRLDSTLREGGATQRQTVGALVLMDIAAIAGQVTAARQAVNDSIQAIENELVAAAGPNETRLGEIFTQLLDSSGTPGQLKKLVDILGASARSPVTPEEEESIRGLLGLVAFVVQGQIDGRAYFEQKKIEPTLSGQTIKSIQNLDWERLSRVAGMRLASLRTALDFLGMGAADRQAVNLSGEGFATLSLDAAVNGIQDFAEKISKQSKTLEVDVSAARAEAANWRKIAESAKTLAGSAGGPRVLKLPGLEAMIGALSAALAALEAFGQVCEASQSQVLARTMPFTFGSSGEGQPKVAALHSVIYEGDIAKRIFQRRKDLAGAFSRLQTSERGSCVALQSASEDIAIIWAVQRDDRVN